MKARNDVILIKAAPWDDINFRFSVVVKKCIPQIMIISLNPLKPQTNFLYT